MKITDTIRYAGVNDHQIDLFEGQYKVPNGMSYNSYVILDDKIAVMDTVEYPADSRWTYTRLSDRTAYGTGPCRKRCKLPQSLSRHYGCFQYESIQHDPEFL